MQFGPRRPSGAGKRRAADGPGTAPAGAGAPAQRRRGEPFRGIPQYDPWMSSNPAGTALLAVGVIVLCGVSAWFGATLGATAQPASHAPPSNAERDLKDALERLDEMERAVMNLERKLEITTENARAALDLVNEQAARQGVAAAGPLNPTPGGTGTKPVAVEPPATPMTHEEVVADRMKQAEEIARRIWPDLVRTEFGVITGTTTDHDQNRRAKASLEATATTLFLGLKADAEMKFRDVFTEQWTSFHSEITPLVPQGIEKADIAAVTAKMKSIWARTDERMREILDEETYKRWAPYAEGNRARVTMALDDIAAGK